ncbi:MAG: hypothetical protein HRU27_11075 [Rhizobiaceae bacterium]|nr:hypothetical protein [Hyphomicrobiales bacterium]NRB31127.1 hypothetical protein [Rhizobiaceae bacterium]
MTSDNDKPERMTKQDYKAHLKDMHDKFEEKGWNANDRKDYMTARAVFDHAAQNGDKREAPEDMQQGDPDYAEMLRREAAAAFVRDVFRIR